MFRIIKLATYAFIGYFLYELILGITDHRPAVKPAEASKRRRRVNITGSTGEGARVPVRDGSGGERTQTVGRGVVS